MTPIEQQFAILQAEYQDAQLTKLPDGTYLVTVPNIPLPAGWSRNTVTVKFIVPVGYPFGRPDCFWTDADLRLANSAVPQATGANQLPHSTGQHLWFSWHVSAWNPNSDNLLTFLRVIERRFSDVR